MNKKKILIGVAAVVVIAGGFWFFKGSSQKKVVRLETAKVESNSISNSVTATGTVAPVTEVEVGTQVSGIIDKLYADYNDVVKAGQLIAEMDRVNLKAELASAQAQLASSKAEYEYQSKNYARNKVLFEKKLISDSDYETATYNYEKAKATYDQAQASMVKVNRNLEYATITSPIDGVIIDRAVEEGQTVAAGFETPTLFTIAADLTKMQVVADVDEADIGNVENGQRVVFTVDAYPNDVFEGYVTQVRMGATGTSSSSSSSSSSTSTVVTYEVVISADNPDLKLKPRLTANVTIYTLEKENVLTIPTKAMRFVPNVEELEAIGYQVSNPDTQAPQNKRLVWVVNGKTLEPKAITVGATSGSNIEVLEGLNKDEVVAEGLEITTKQEAAQSQTEQSPFMPTPPGQKKNK